MHKKYRVTLTLAERQELERLLARSKAEVCKIKHAQILLKADEADGGPAWSGERLAEAIEAGTATVERVRRRFVEQGLASALSPDRGGKRLDKRKLDGAQGGAPGRAGLLGSALRGAGAGHYAFSRPAWSNSPMWTRCPMRRYARRSQKRAQAASEEDGVHPRQALGRVRLPQGGRAGGLP